MDNTIIIILGIILFVLIILNNITIVRNPIITKASCAQTAFGCCPDGINSKINFYGTNCPSYRPGPGYYPTTHVLTPTHGVKTITSCIGTKYGCCPKPFGRTPKMDEKGSNCILK
jgi:hypothetical protein